MPKACTSENVVGELAGLLESAGITPEAGALDALGASGKNYYNKTVTKNGDDLDVLHPSPFSEKVKSFWERNPLTGDLKPLIGKIITDARNPSGILGEKTLEPVLKFHQDHFKNVYSKIGSDSDYITAIKAYKKGIKEALKAVDTSGFNESQKGYFEKYKQFYKKGGEFYPTETEGTGINQALNNLVTNQIQNSLAVLLGNPLEVAIKLPALYGDNAFKGLGEYITRGAALKKLPELVEAGVYGVKWLDAAETKWYEKLNRRWEGLIQFTDIPTKNAAYLAGKAKGGHEEGLKAVQDVMFTPRFGDLPSQRWGSAGRNESKLLTYTVNTAKMHFSLWRQLLHKQSNMKSRLQAGAGLAWMHGVAFGIGGTGAFITDEQLKFIRQYAPEAADVLEEYKEPFLNKVIAAVSPEIGNFLEENDLSLGGLVQSQGINRVFVAGSIMERKIQKASKMMGKAFESLQNGDHLGFAVDAGLSFVTGVLSFTKSGLGDAQVQKLLYLGRDMMKDELDGPLGDELIEDFAPWAKPKK